MVAPPEHIGAYRIVRVLGEGAMGIVYEAEAPAGGGRTVALKVIRLGMDTSEVLARFETERHALSVMDHPQIAKVLDAGETDEGRPFFVMEHVVGTPLTEYCDQARLTVDQRLALFILVCDAVQHAHQKGVIHRDLKPSNVLVSELRGEPSPRVIDFGIAKATGNPMVAAAVRTATGLIVGTPAYMSPEQASAVLDIDTRADIYSLGVMLYELLTGALPFDDSRAASPAVLVHQLLVADPPTPSSRIRRITDPEVPAMRRTDPARLQRELRGDLDWIVLKALERDRSRRYATANALALDLQRFLDDDVVSARPPSARYRFRKFVRRNRAGVAGGLVALLALVAGGTATALGLVQARREARLAASRELAATALGRVAWDRDLGLLLALRAVAVAPTSQAEDALVRALDTRLVLTLRGHSEAVSGAALASDGQTIATAGLDGTVRLWEASTGRELRELNVRGGPVHAIGFSHDGHAVVTAHADGRTIVWDTSDGSIVTALPGHAIPLSVVFAPDGQHVATTSDDGIVSMRDVASAREVLTFTGHDQRIGRPDCGSVQS